MRALGRELPCDAGIPFPPRLRGRGHHGHKQRSRGDLPAYLNIPRIAADEFALVEPYLDAGGAQCVANALRRHRVLGRVAQENGTIGRSWLAVRHVSVGRKPVPCPLRPNEAKARIPQMPLVGGGGESSVSKAKDWGTPVNARPVVFRGDVTDGQRREDVTCGPHQKTAWRIRRLSVF